MVVIQKKGKVILLVKEMIVFQNTSNSQPLLETLVRFFSLLLVLQLAVCISHTA